MATSKKRKGLGNLGVDILLSTPVDTTTPPEKPASGSGLDYLAIDLIDRSPYQPRQHFSEEALEELAESIRSQGLIQPIVVRKAQNRYELIAGERRWRAAQRAQLQEIPAVIKEVDDQAAAAMALVENLQRENLNPIEEAYAMANLVEQFQWTHQEVADAIGKARATVSNLLRLIECPAEVRNLIKQGQLSMGHARALLALPDKQQAKIADIVVLKQLSVRQTEQLVKKTLQDNSGPAQGKSHNKAKDTNIQALENNLADLLGAAVNIKHADSNKGKIEIQYNDLDELDGILRQFKLKL